MKQPNYNPEWHQQYYQERKAAAKENNLCIQCSRIKEDPAETRCSNCKKKRNVSRNSSYRERFAAAKIAGICFYCNKPKETVDADRCNACKEKRKARRKKNYIDNKAKKICIHCKGENDRLPSVRCSSCAAKTRNYRAHRKDDYQLDKALGNCVNCHKPKESDRGHKKAYCSLCEKLLAGKKGHLRRLYGLTMEDYYEMFSAQNGLCKICTKTCAPYTTEGLVVDHCHASGMVRALLCGDCNRMLGLAKDDITVLERAANYLREYEKIKYKDTHDPELSRNAPKSSRSISAGGG